MANVMLTFGSGGHTTEMLGLVRNAKLAERLKGSYKKHLAINKVVCVISEDDKIARGKLVEYFADLGDSHKLRIVTTRRPRRVGQSYLTSVWSTLLVIFQALLIAIQTKPDLCITNGPGLSVTMALAIRLVLTPITWRWCHIIYVESFCRVESLSLSGKLIYHTRLADQFYVQWSDLIKEYRRAKFAGILV